MRLYHGSSINIKDEYLSPHKPFKTYDYKSSIYFSDKIEIALLYSINPIMNYIKLNNKEEKANAFSSYFKYDRENNITILYECYKGMLNEVYNNPSYIYIVDVEESVANEHIEFNSYRFFTPIKYLKKIYIPNVLDELLKLEKKDKIKIIRFEDMSFNVKNELYDSISDRANSCEHQCEIDFFKEKFKNVQTIQNYLRLKNDED